MLWSPLWSTILWHHGYPPSFKSWNSDIYIVLQQLIQEFLSCILGPNLAQNITSSSNVCPLSPELAPKRLIWPFFDLFHHYHAVGFVVRPSSYCAPSVYWQFRFWESESTVPRSHKKCHKEHYNPIRGIATRNFMSGNPIICWGLVVIKVCTYCAATSTINTTGALRRKGDGQVRNAMNMAINSPRMTK